MNQKQTSLLVAEKQMRRARVQLEPVHARRVRHRDTHASDTVLRVRSRTQSTNRVVTVIRKSVAVVSS